MTAPALTASCPAWCTVDHTAPAAELEEQREGVRFHTLKVGAIGDAAVYVNRNDPLDGEPGTTSIWAHTDGEDLNTDQSLRYCALVADAITIAREAAA